MNDNAIWLATSIANAALAGFLIWNGNWKRARILALNHAVSIVIAVFMAYLYFAPSITDRIYHNWKLVTDQFGMAWIALLLYEAAIPTAARFLIFGMGIVHWYMKLVDYRIMGDGDAFAAAIHHDRKLWNIAVIVSCCIAVYAMDGANAHTRRTP